MAAPHWPGHYGKVPPVHDGGSCSNRVTPYTFTTHLSRHLGRAVRWHEHFRFVRCAVAVIAESHGVGNLTPRSMWASAADESPGELRPCFEDLRQINSLGQAGSMNGLKLAWEDDMERLARVIEWAAQPRLMDQMTDCLRLSTVQAAWPNSDISEADRRCLSCSHADECEAWLSDLKTRQSADAPDFCLNASYFQRLPLNSGDTSFA
jgi:hypothetical protein